MTDHDFGQRVIKARFIPTDENTRLARICHIVIRRARSHCARRIRLARAKFHSVRDSRLKESEQRGYALGLAKADADYATRVASLFHLEKELVTHVHNQCLEVAVTAAEEIVGKLLPSDVEAMMHRIGRELATLYDRRGVTLRVPDGSAHDIRTALAHREIPMDVKGDPTLLEGELVIETNAGTIRTSARKELDDFARQLRVSIGIECRE